MIYSESTVIKMNGVAHHYQELIYRAVHSVLSEPRYRNTGAGVNSLKVEVIDGDANKGPQIIIAFDDHLIFLNQRKIEWIKLPVMKDLIAWAETKTSSNREAVRMAWAVAWDKKKKDTWKPKLWRKRSLSTVLKEMNVLVLKAFDEAIEEDFIKAVNG